MENTKEMKFDTTRYKIETWKNPRMLTWIIIPIAVIDELILGKRMPQIMLQDKTIAKPRFERRFVPCPHCGKIHDNRTWSSINGTAYKNWFGLYCNNCGNTIPCLINFISFLILAITFPIWFWFKNPLKKRWLKSQPERFKNLYLESIPYALGGKDWLKSGLGWGLTMYIFMTFLFPLFDKTDITLKWSLISFPLWIIGGIGFGYIEKLLIERKRRKTAI